MIIIIYHDQVPQLQMPGSTRGFARDTLHCTAITEKGKRMVIDQLETGLIKFGCSMGLCNGKTHGIGEPLTKWTCGHLDAWSILSFWMTRSNAINGLSNKISPKPLLPIDWEDPLGKLSSRLKTPRSRKDGEEHIVACNHGHSYHTHCISTVCTVDILKTLDV